MKMLENQLDHYLCLLCNHQIEAPADGIPPCPRCGLESGVIRIVENKVPARESEIREYVRKYSGKQSIAKMARVLRTTKSCILRHRKALGIKESYSDYARRLSMRRLRT